MKSILEKTSDKLVNAFLKNKIIAPIPSKFTKKLKEAQKLRVLCESKIKLPKQSSQELLQAKEAPS